MTKQPRRLSKTAGRVLSSVVASQVAEHRLYGGVVPEIASRRHAEVISKVVSQSLVEANVTLKDITAIAVTYAPGLIGALLVGVNFAKGLSLCDGASACACTSSALAHSVKLHFKFRIKAAVFVFGSFGRSQSYSDG